MNLYALLINTDDLWKALEIMWKGVLAIAIVIALVIIVTAIVNKVCVNAETAKKQKETKDTENDSAGS